jgi:hypothetical protein
MYKTINQTGQDELMANLIGNIKGATLENLDPVFDDAERVANNTPDSDDMVLEYSRHETLDGNIYTITMPVEWFKVI